MSDNKKLPKYLSWEKQGDLYCIQVQYNDGKIIPAYKKEADFKFELFKRKLESEYNLPYHVISELDDVVVDLCNQAVEDSSID